MKTLLIVMCLLVNATAQKITTVHWNTKHGAPEASIHQTNPRFAKLFQFGVSNISEPLIMQFAGIGGAKLGLNEKQAATLHEAISGYYLKMGKESKDGKFPTIPSALEYCFSKQKPKKGFATVYQPKVIDKNTQSIVFLHGFGGSFSYYLHYLASIFPDHFIICPAYGISMANVPQSYLTECKLAVEKEVKFKLRKPTLIGLSAGGYGGFRHYSKNIDSYDRYICIASLPPRDMVKPLDKNSIIRPIAGGDEAYVKSKLLDARIKRLKLTNYKEVILPNQEHFFMLTDEAKTKASLKEMISD